MTSLEIPISEQQTQEQPIPFLCEIDRKPQAIPKNFGPCIIKECKNNSKYVCPKCRSSYCSLNCYKLHGDECVNEFYAENVKEEMKNKKCDDETQKKMRALLKEYKEQLDSDKEEFDVPKKKIERLEELEAMLEENEVKLDDLNLEEQREFAEFISDPSLVQKFIKQWVPWWKQSDGQFSLFVEEVEESNNSNENNKDGKKKQGNDKLQEQIIEELIEFRQNMKERIKKIVSFKELCKVQPHKDLPFQLTNIILGFVFALRIYNGEVEDESLECFNLFQSISKSANPLNREELGSIENAISNVMIQAIRQEKEIAKVLSPVIKEDIAIIFDDKFFLLECLFRLYDLLHLCQINLINQESEEDDATKQTIKNIAKIKQKIIFFLSYTKDIIPPQKLKEMRQSVIDLKLQNEELQEQQEKLQQIKKLGQLVS